MVVRKNDTVVLIKDITSCKNAEGSIISDKGQRTRVLAAFPAVKKVLLQHTNYRWKHVRPDRDNPRGGRVQREVKVDATNVLLWCEKCQRGVRVRAERRPDEGKVRLCAKCNSVIPVVL
ncbi:50S ribosomal protein L24 [bacterium]|nr:50S ribosomal protein L24 [bacterium]